MDVWTQLVENYFSFRLRHLVVTQFILGVVIWFYLVEDLYESKTFPDHIRNDKGSETTITATITGRFFQIKDHVRITKEETNMLISNIRTFHFQLGIILSLSLCLSLSLSLSLSKYFHILSGPDDPSQLSFQKMFIWDSFILVTPFICFLDEFQTEK